MKNVFEKKNRSSYQILTDDGFLSKKDALWLLRYIEERDSSGDPQLSLTSKEHNAIPEKGTRV